MSLVSEILEAQNSIVEGVLAEDPLTESTFNVLPDAQQRYLSGIGEDLGYAPDDLRTEEDWEALDEGEAKRLQQETEELFYEQSTLNALIGGDIAKTELRARELAEESLIDGRYDQAAGVSATRERWAEADVANNDEFRLSQVDSMKELQRVQENEAAMTEFQQKLEKKAKGSTKWEGFKNFAGDFVGNAPGFEAWRYKQAINALGLERVIDFSKGGWKELLKTVGNTADASTYKRIFAAAMTSIAYDNRSVDYQRLSALMKKMEETWDAKGINPYVQADLMGQVLDYSPSFSTFNAATLPLVGMQASKFVGRAGLAASKGLWINAGGQIAKAAGEVAGIPFSEAAVNASERGISRIARRFRPASDLGKTLDKALETKNRAIIAETVEDIVGKPTDQSFGIKASKAEKEDYIDYFVDEIVSPTASPKTSLANDPATIARKIDKAQADNLRAAIKTHSLLTDQQETELTKLFKSVANSLDITHLEGIGRGNAGEKIVGLSDIMFTKNDNIDFIVRLGDKGGPLSPRMSVIKNGVDVGRKRAEKDGRAFVKAIKSTSDSPYAKDLDYKLDLVDGQWKVSLVIPTNKGFGTIFYNALVEQGLMKQKDWRPLLSGLFTVTSNPSDIRMADALREIEGAMIRSTGKSVIDSFKDLPKKDRALVQALADISTKYESWFPTEHLLARGVSEGAADVYAKFRAMNDYAEFVRNKTMRQMLVSKGAKKVYFNNEPLEGAVRPITNYHTASELKTKIGNRGVLVDSVNGTPMILEADEIEDYFNKGYVLIEPSISPDATIAASSFYYLLNPQGTTINDLGAFVTTYVAGGRRFFQRNASYVKQLILRDTGVAGRQAIVGVQTFFTDLDGIGLTNRTDALNTARDLYMQRKYDECTKFIADQGWYKAPFKNAQEFYEFFSQRGMDFVNPENRLEVVAGKNILKSYDYYKTLDNVDDLVGFEGMQEFARNSHYQAITNEEKVRRMSRSGRELLTWDFEAAEPVDFEMQMRYIVNDMIQEGVMGTFTDFYAERFAKTFKGVIMNPGKAEQTPREMLLSGQIKQGLTGRDAQLAKQAETAQKNYAMIRGIPSKIDTAIAEKGRAFFEWVVEGSSKNLYLSEQAAHRARVLWNVYSDKNYLQMAREWASQYTMGLFNISQFWKQISQDFSIYFMDKLAADVAGDAFRLVPIMEKASGNRVVAEKLVREAFKSDPEMLNNAMNIIDMGLFEHGTAGGFIERGESIKSTFNRISYMPFNAGEMHARLLAGLTSLKRNNLYGLRASTDQLKGPLVYAHSLFMNMDGSGISRLQKSEVASTILQFQSPRLRFIETMLFDKNLTGKQKARWAIGLSALVGTEGVLGVTASSWITTNIYNMFHSIDETELPALEDRNEIMRLVQRGLLNYASETAGIGTDFSQLVGAPEILEPLDYFFGAPSLGNIVSFEVPYKAVKEGLRLAKVSYDSFFGDATGDDFLSALEIATQNAAPSSIKKPVLAFLMYNTGVRLNSKGELSERMNGMLEPVLYGLGFGRLSDKDMAKYYVDLRDYSQRMKAIEDEGYPTFVQWLRTGSAYYRSQVEDYLKFSNLNNMDRSKVLQKWMEKAGKNLGLTSVERGLLNQYSSGGSSGNNLINLNK